MSHRPPPNRADHVDAIDLGPARLREFSDIADRWEDGLTRRRFLEIMGASFALAGLEGCVQQPQEKIVPFVAAPEMLVPGVPLYFATAMSLDGDSIGLLATSHMGRPTKLDGNPLHPSVPSIMAGAPEPARGARPRLGASNAFTQAAVLGLYDPDRSQTVTFRGQPSTWDDFLTASATELAKLRSVDGVGLHVLSGEILSPTLADELHRLREALPRMQLHHFEPLGRDNALAGSQMAFGEFLTPLAEISRADVVVSFDADFLASGPGALQNLRAFAERRRPNDGDVGVRLHVVESTLTTTGAAADHRWDVRASEVGMIAQLVAERLGFPRSDQTVAAPEELNEPAAAIAADLQQAGARGVVLVGRNQPAEIHALAHWINDAQGSTGDAVRLVQPAEFDPGLSIDSLRTLVAALDAGKVQALVILGGNPAFDAPVDLSLVDRLSRVPFTVRLGPYEDETSALCQWHVPEAHFLESWGDARSVGGSAAIIQPLIAPMYDGKTAVEAIAALAGRPEVRVHELVRDHWRKEHRDAGWAGDFEAFWQTALHDGVIAETVEPTSARAPTLAADLVDRLRSREAEPVPRVPEGSSLSIEFRPDAATWDGRFANNAWLQELPRPLTSLTWDNAAQISAHDAQANGVASGDVVEISVGERRLELPAIVVPGQPSGSVTVHVGYGRRRAGRVGDGVGADAYSLRTSDTMWSAPCTLRSVGARRDLALTQHHHSMEGRDMVRYGSLAELKHNPQSPAFMHGSKAPAQDESLYPLRNYDGNKWGMVIDLSKCIGCQACVVACQAENNIPVVGREEVLHEREMHWLRIDHYAEREESQLRHLHQPVPCMHCEMAPCELVCPVAATTHSDEGLNEMTYNRCVGTRYCSNNCPYKVRRFNFLDYNQPLRQEPALQLLPNPNVTVRSRGVMEKCTYCVQRISAARIQSEIDNRPIRDGEVVTACQAACSAEAIVFGNLNDSDSRVARLAHDPLNYALLAELNTRPRTTYLAAVKNTLPGVVEEDEK